MKDKDSAILCEPLSERRTLVLIGFAEALSSPEVAWSLVDAGFEVHAIARRGRKCALRRSRLVSILEITPPEVSCSGAIKDLTGALARIVPAAGDKVILPLDDTAVWLFAELQGIGNWIVAGPDRNGSVLALDKWRQIEIARRAGFSVPASAIAHSKTDLRGCGLKFPIIIRPSRAIAVIGDRLGKGANWICDESGEMEMAIRNWDESEPLLVQEYIEGQGEGLFGLSIEGHGSAWSAHRRLRMMNPHGSGSSACASRGVESELRKVGDMFLSRAKWNGLFMIELLRDQSNRVWFIEFNGRPWGSMALARRMGLEYPAWAVMRALGHSVPNESAVNEPPKDLVCRNAGRELMHMFFVFKGPKSKAIAHWPSKWRAVKDVLGIRRGDALYNWRRGDWLVFLFDIIYTIRGNVLKTRR